MASDGAPAAVSWGPTSPPELVEQLPEGVRTDQLELVDGPAPG